MSSFWLALQFLTRLPTPALAMIEPLQVGRSLAWYPLVGGLLGGMGPVGCCRDRSHSSPLPYCSRFGSFSVAHYTWMGWLTRPMPGLVAWEIVNTP